MNLRDGLLYRGQEAGHLLARADGDAQTPQTAVLFAPEADYHPLGLGQSLVHGQGGDVVWLALGIEDLVEEEVALCAAAEPANTLNLGEFSLQSVALLDDSGDLGSHRGDALRRESQGGEDAGGLRDVVRCLEAVEKRRDGLRGEDGAEAAADVIERSLGAASSRAVA